MEDAGGNIQHPIPARNLPRIAPGGASTRAGKPRRTPPLAKTAVLQRPSCAPTPMMRRGFPDRQSSSRSTVQLHPRAGAHARTRGSANLGNIRRCEGGDGMVATPPELAKVRRRRRPRHYRRPVSAALGNRVSDLLAAFGPPPPLPRQIPHPQAGLAREPMREGSRDAAANPVLVVGPARAFDRRGRRLAVQRLLAILDRLGFRVGAGTAAGGRRLLVAKPQPLGRFIGVPWLRAHLAAPGLGRRRPGLSLGRRLRFLRLRERRHDGHRHQGRGCN